ncbi:nuclear transport factor 2 family protein [Parasphingorhabdus sp.]|uniref:nuclear transport factor 2 family protein n=1 Tax=Parasphingorhabdus sp. TaxID=2709688 RepID=UPI003001DECD
MRPRNMILIATLFAMTGYPAIAAEPVPAPLPARQPGPATLDDAALFDTLATLDSALFTAAFGTCDIARVRALAADDLEFYDDRSGLAYGSGDAFVAGINCLNWTRGNDPQIARRLVPESLTVERLGNWGAMQRGRHQFYLVVPDGEDRLEGDADFIHLWRHDATGWKIARVISYGHRAVVK